MNWSPQTLTAVIFTAPTAPVGSAYDIYKTLVGHAPNNSNETPHPLGVSSRATGPVALGLLTVTLQVGRLDITLSPSLPVGVPDPKAGPPIFKDVDTPLEEVLGFGRKVATDLNPVRVALISNLVQHAANKEEAVRLFCEATGIHSIPKAAWDLQFGFNVRKPFGSAGWEMNRLCNCGIGTLKWMQVQMGPSGPSQTVMEGAYFASMTVDVNTVLRPNVSLGPTQATKAFDDLANELKSIIRSGYDYLTSS